MASLVTALGLRTAGAGLSAPNWAPGLLGWQFFFAYGLLSSRTLKQWYGIDHNSSPREDLAKYGDAAVRSGKLTPKQLAMLRRNESAHANSVENYTLFVAAMGFATFAGVDNHLINRAGLLYAVARLAYGAVYILIDHDVWSQIRGLTWWTGNLSCLWLLYRAGAKLNAA
ncbi:putative membrane- eicosanoid glutathione metabolism protein [Rosellinia necatrix]|uniref:Putative membrane-eicosanoid glutathione metabolism protein n=1 Tax=Rosellinia necatrix TaxID=77044 RepID=A0A1W2TU39_ROSNE|nr:putative membrane- eicosanoid glutathione metabolism protein [Rosellinia necatrix]